MITAPAGGGDTGLYHLGAKIGEGSFGTVFKAVRRTDSQTVVIKQVGLKMLNAAQRDEARNEVALLRSLEHPHIVRYHGSFVDAAGLNIVMEFAARGDLHAKISSVKKRGKHITEAAVWRYALQTAEALAFIHARKVLHRDLKPANIFLDANGDAKLGDFGVSKLLANTAELAHTRVGTPYYMSPELVSGSAYNDKCDVWALGCVVYELCELAPPFDAQNIGALVLKIVSGDWKPLSEDGAYSAPLSAFVSTCLTRDTTRRPSVAELLAVPAVQDQVAQLKQQRPQTPSSPMNRVPSQLVSQIQERPSSRSDAAAVGVYAPRQARTPVPKVSRTPVSAKRQDEQGKRAAPRRMERPARQSPPQRQRKPMGSRAVPSPKFGAGKAAVGAGSTRDREIKAVRALPEEVTISDHLAAPYLNSDERHRLQHEKLRQLQQQLRPARVPRQQQAAAEPPSAPRGGNIEMGAGWGMYADVLPTALLEELQAAQELGEGDHQQQRVHENCHHDNVAGEASQQQDWRKEAYPSPGADAEFAAEPEEDEIRAGVRSADLEKEDGCCNGVVQTAWEIGTESAALVTPRLDDDNRKRRIRQQQHPQPTQPVLQNCAGAATTEEADGRGWRTMARERACEPQLVDWDLAVTVEDLGMTVDAVVPSGRLCCA